MATRLETSEADVCADARSRGTYHFLDVGGAKYGECVLVVFGGKRILIDGSHQQDFKGQVGYRSIPQQLSDILGEAAPHDIDLIVEPTDTPTMWAACLTVRERRHPPELRLRHASQGRLRTRHGRGRSR